MSPQALNSLRRHSHGGVASPLQRGLLPQSPRSDRPRNLTLLGARGGRFGARAERIHHQARLERGSLVGVRLLEPGPPVTSSASGWRRSDRYPTAYISRSPRICPARVSVSAASIVVAFSVAVRPGELRSRACKCSHGHRPSGCDTEARGRRATLPQRHRRGVGGSLTRTPLRRAYRLQRTCSLPIVRDYVGSA